jgi:hypothetical protein
MYLWRNNLIKLFFRHTFILPIKVMNSNLMCWMFYRYTSILTIYQLHKELHLKSVIQFHFNICFKASFKFHWNLTVNIIFICTVLRLCLLLVKHFETFLLLIFSRFGFLTLCLVQCSFIALCSSFCILLTICLQGWFAWQCVCECMEVMVMLQNVSYGFMFVSVLCDYVCVILRELVSLHTIRQACYPL